MAKDQQQELPLDDDTQQTELQTELEQAAPPAEEPSSTSPPAEPATPGDQEEEFVSIRDAASQYGLDLSQYADDEAALRALAEQANKAREYEQYLAQLQQLQQQQQLQEQQQQQQAEKPKHWDAPEYNPAWLNQIRRDENGQLVPDFSQGGSPETVAKLQRYIQFRQDQQEKFWQNPFDYMGSYIDERIQERASDLVQQQIQQYRETSRAREIISQNRDWLFQTNNDGSPVVQNGRLVLSPKGQVFQEHLAKFEARGLPLDDAYQSARELTDAQFRGQEQTAANENGKEKFLKEAAGHTANASASTNRRADETGTAPPQNENMSLDQLMMANLKKAGITDEDIQGIH